MAKYGFTIRKEEYTTLADFIRASFTRDLATFTERFPKFNAAFLAAFIAKLNFVKQLESTFLITEDQKNVTASLYKEADELNNELNYLKENFKDANLTLSIITDIKNDLFNHNIEGAILKIETLKQYIIAHQPALEAEGMAPTFPATLDTHKSSLQEKNTAQKKFMDNSKTLTDANKAHYDELYTLIVKIANKGKVLFKGKVTADEYSITKNLQKMRAASPKPKQP